MKKIFSKIMTVAFILCSSVMLFACGKNVNIKSIAIAGTMPDYVIIGEFDEANIKILVTYEDDTSEEVAVTTNMIAEADRHYLTEAGVYNVTILFKGKSTVITVKMVEQEAVHIVKFYDGNGHIILSQFVVTGEDATAPDASWATMRGYNFIGWDRAFTNITEDTNVYGVYSKIENTLTQETIKQKLITANNYFEQHDHLSSCALVEDDQAIEVASVNYHFNNGEYTSQYTSKNNGYEYFADINDSGFVMYNKHVDGEMIQYHNANNSYLKNLVFNLALTGNTTEMPLISDIIASNSVNYTSILYGNRNLYSAVYTQTNDDFSQEMAIIYDDEKVLTITYKCTYGNMTSEYRMYVDYLTVAHQTFDYASKINFDEYKTKLAEQLALLKTTDWTASMGEQQVSHTANSDTVIVGDETKKLTDIILEFNCDAVFYGISTFVKENKTTVSLAWQTDEQTFGYDFVDGKLSILRFNDCENDENNYVIIFA